MVLIVDKKNAPEKTGVKLKYDENNSFSFSRNKLKNTITIEIKKKTFYTFFIIRKIFVKTSKH